MVPQVTYKEFKATKRSQTDKIHLPISRHKEDYSFDLPPPAPYTNYIAYNPDGVISEKDGITKILSEPLLIIERQLQILEISLGVIQRNKYVIKNCQGHMLGYIEEKGEGLGNTLVRQFVKKHRPFVFDVFDNHGNLVMNIKRSYQLINSHVKAVLPNDSVIGESVEKFHVLKRQYRLFQAENPSSFQQFGYINAPSFSHDFSIADEEGSTIGAVDRNWSGLAREMFTDTNVYILRMDPWAFQSVKQYYSEVQGAMTLDQRAVLLANTISIDFDYFSKNEDK
jgi:hypothetical protein